MNPVDSMGLRCAEMETLNWAGVATLRYCGLDLNDANSGDCRRTEFAAGSAVAARIRVYVCGIMPGCSPRGLREPLKSP